MRSAIHIILLTLALVATSVVSTPIACADDAVTRTAKRHFTTGEKLFALGRFDEALEEYQMAFDAKPIAGFLFNIGQCYRNLGNLDQAIFSFRKYLTLQPDAPNTESVQQLIAELEDRKSREDGQRLVGPQKKRMEENNETPPESKPIYKKWWFWAGVGVATVAVGTTVYLATRPSSPTTSLGDIGLNR
jgi:tetratricopeptide (TPR) repeat protein